MRAMLFVSMVGATLVFVGCDRSSRSSGGGSSPGSATTSKSEPEHQPGENPDLAHESGKEQDQAPAQGSGPAGHGGAVVELGTTQIGGFTVRATRDQGEIKPGGDAPIDVWVTTAGGEPAKVAAVRFWIGTEDAKGSIKAKAEIEDPKQPNHWHTHVEVPEPLPAGGKLWIEIELPGGAKVAAGLALEK